MGQMGSGYWSFCLADWKLRASHDLIPRFDNSLGLTELRKVLHLCLLIYYKGYNWTTAKWKGCVEQGMRGKESRVAISSLGAPLHTPSTSVHSPTQMSLNASIEGFFLRFPYVVWWIKSLAIGDWMWFPAPLSFRGGRWMEGEVLLIVLTLYSEDWFFWPSTATLKLPSSVIYLFIYYLYLFTRVALLAWTQVWSKGFIMNKRLAYHLGNSKGLRSPMPGAWDIHQILFNLYYTTQTQWRRE